MEQYDADLARSGAGVIARISHRGPGAVAIGPVTVATTSATTAWARFARDPPRRRRASPWPGIRWCLHRLPRSCAGRPSGGKSRLINPRRARYAGNRAPRPQSDRPSEGGEFHAISMNCFRCRASVAARGCHLAPTGARHGRRCRSYALSASNGVMSGRTPADLGMDQVSNRWS